jgi:hypothetical protein
MNVTNATDEGRGKRTSQVHLHGDGPMLLEAVHEVAGYDSNLV